MTTLKIAASACVALNLHTQRVIVPLDSTDFTDVAAVRIPMIPVSDSDDFDRASRATFFLL